MVVCSVLFDGLLSLGPFICRGLSITSSQWEAMLGLGTLCFASSQYLSAFIFKHYAPPRCHAIAALAMGVGALILAGQSYAILFGVVLTSLFSCNGIAAAAGRAMLRAQCGPAKFQRIMAAVNGVMSGLGVLAPLLLVQVAAYSTWRLPIAVLALFLLGIALTQAGSWRDAQAVSGPPPATVLLHRLFRSRAFVAPTLLLGCTQGSFSALMIAKPLVLADTFGMTPEGLGRTLAGIALALSGGFFLTSSLPARLRSPLRLWIAVGFEGAAIACLALARHGQLWAFIAASVLVALAFSMVLPLATAWVLHRVPAERGSASALHGFLCGITTGAIVLLASRSALAPLESLLACTTACAIATAAIAAHSTRHGIPV
jgi:MFS family permease